MGKVIGLTFPKDKPKSPANPKDKPKGGADDKKLENE